MNESTFITPPPVTLSGLRNHFVTTYGLGDEQADLMVTSSRRSLQKIFGEVGFALAKEDCSGKMVGICHSLKGLLLNMGEPAWAMVARDLEAAAREGQVVDYRLAFARFQEGMAEILAGEADPLP